jgi:hypothetical protein
MKRKKPDWTPFQPALLADTPAEHTRLMHLIWEVDHERAMGCIKLGAVA